MSILKKEIKILTYRWHVSHQYELWKFGHFITLVHGLGTQMCNAWDYSRRPFPENVAFKNIAHIEPKKYDLAILHFDENVLRPELCNGKKELDWGDTFKYMLELTKKMPRVAICHGTPQFIGQFDLDFRPDGPVQVYEESREELVNCVRDTLVICNSYQAEREWGFARSKTIWHGFSPSEFTFGTHEKDCLAPFEPFIKLRGYYNGYHEMENLKQLLTGKLNVEHTYTPDPEGNFTSKQDYAVAKYANYRRTIGRYSFYLNTTLRSPMPRARGEAMMSGVIPLTLRNHDTDMFIQNGINGYTADSVEELAEFALYLKKHPAIKEKLSIAARETAITYFNSKRYLSAWKSVLSELI